MQHGKVIAYDSRQLKVHEQNYATHDPWTPDYDLMMDQIQRIEGVTLGDHDLEV